MRWLRNLISNLATKSPAVQRVLNRAGDAIKESNLIKEAARYDALMGQEVELQYAMLRRRMNDLLDLRRAEVACFAPDAEIINESWKGPVDDVAQFRERLWELELALEDRGWVREVTLAALEFSRYGVQQLIRIVRIYAIKNPLIKRGAEICALYVFARGVEIRSDDEPSNETIQDFLDRNKAEFGHTALAAKEQSIQTDGSLYFGLATDNKGVVTVHMIEPLEVMDVVTDPDNTSIPWFFHRQWNRSVFNAAQGVTNEPMKGWYPSLEYLDSMPQGKPATIRSEKVNWDMPVFRVKIGCPANWRWGIPPLYASVDWARAFKDFLEDWATVQRTLARFALMIETKGGPGAIAAYQALLSTTFADASGTQIERNPPPVVGSAHVSGPGNQIQAFKSAGASTAPEQARRLLLMVAAAQGLPETFYGDASTGSLATAQSLDRPTELKFKEIQARWNDAGTRILRYVLDVASKTPGNKLREARKSNPAPQPAQIIWKFPAILEHDIMAMIDAIAHIGTLGGRNGIAAGVVDRRWLADSMLSEYGVDNRTEILDAMGYGDDYDAEQDIVNQRTTAPPQNINPVTPAPGATPEPAPKATAKAGESLRAVVRELQALRNGHD